MTDLLFPELAKPTTPESQPDTIGDALIQNGLVPNRFVLDLNGALTIPSDLERPYPWSLPSRLFIFPIDVTHQLDDGSRVMTLRHPLLAEHPLVKRAEESMSVHIEAGTEPSSQVQWWHAVDLISRGLWRESLDTARFTTPEYIAGAVSYGLHYSPHDGKKRNGYISTVEAREIMSFIESPEPGDRKSILREHFMSPSKCESEKGSVSWPVNYTGDRDAVAWGMILAIECGWFAHDRAGFLGWTALGRETFPPQARVAAPKVEPPVKPPQLPSGRPATEIADKIAPRPAVKADEQLDLF